MKRFQDAQKLATELNDTQDPGFRCLHRNRTINMLRRIAYKKITVRLKRALGADQNQRFVIRLVCVRSPEYYGTNDDNFYPDHDWDQVFGIRHEVASCQVDDNLLEFRDLAEKYIPPIRQRGPRISISGRLESAIDLFEELKIRGRDSALEWADQILSLLTRDIRRNYRIIARHRARVEICFLVRKELHESVHSPRVIWNMPEWFSRNIFVVIVIFLLYTLRKVDC